MESNNKGEGNSKTNYIFNKLKTEWCLFIGSIFRPIPVLSLLLAAALFIFANTDILTRVHQ